MKFCQRINLNLDWEYKPESTDSKNKSSSSKKSEGSKETYEEEDSSDNDIDISSANEDNDESSSSKTSSDVKKIDGKVTDVIGCNDIDVDSDTWEFSYTMYSFKVFVVVEWQSKNEYKMTSYIEGYEDEKETETKTIEDGESRQSMYDELCGNAK